MRLRSLLSEQLNGPVRKDQKYYIIIYMGCLSYSYFRSLYMLDCLVTSLNSRVLQMAVFNKLKFVSAVLCDLRIRVRILNHIKYDYIHVQKGLNNLCVRVATIKVIVPNPNYLLYL